MELAKNISTRLIAGFIATFLLVVSLIALAWWISADYRHTIERAYQNDLLGTVHLSNAMDASWKLRYGLAQFNTLGPAERERIVKEEARSSAIIESNLGQYAAGKRSPAELQHLTILRASYLRYLDARSKWFELYSTGKLDEAAQWRRTMTIPLGAAAILAFERQISIQREQAKANVDELAAEAVEEQIILFVLLFVLATAVALQGWLAWRMLKQLKTLRSKAEGTMAEVFGEETSPERGDEVDSVMASLDAMTARFISHARELESTKDALTRERAGLESAVGERTLELEQLVRNAAMEAAQATLLYEMGDRLQSCHDLDEAGAVFKIFAPKLFPDEAGAIFMHAQNNALDPMVGWGEVEPEAMESFLPEDCWALKRGKPHFVPSRGTELICAHVPDMPMDPYSCVPMIAHGETVGLLYLQLGTQEETLRDGARVQQLGEVVARQIGLALANLQLRESLRTQAMRDQLTDLYNRRYLDATMEREAAQATRERSPLAVMMLDIDHFKRFNDTFGHEAGDLLLQAVGHLLKQQFRTGDIPCRYGGEEFVIVMPGASLEQARIRAESLREAVRALEVTHKGRALGHLSVSIGVAIMPNHGASAQMLIAAADAALYEAKQAGRDRLIVSGEKFMREAVH